MKSDVELRTDVEEELSCEPSVDATAIGVGVKDGIVTLSGHVASYAEKVAAEQAATQVLGVNAIVTDLDVKLPGSPGRESSCRHVAAARSPGAIGPPFGRRPGSQGIGLCVAHALRDVLRLSPHRYLAHRHGSQTPAR